MTSVLPPQHSERDPYQRARRVPGCARDRRRAVGGERAGQFRDPFAFATWDDYTAAAVVMPHTVEEVQAVVRIANETGSRCGRSARAGTTATAVRHPGQGVGARDPRAT